MHNRTNIVEWEVPNDAKNSHLLFVFDEDLLNSSTLQTSNEIRSYNSLSKLYLYYRSNFSTDILPTYNFGPRPCGLEIFIEEKHVKWAGNHMVRPKVTDHLLGGAPHVELCHPVL